MSAWSRLPHEFAHCAVIIAVPALNTSVSECMPEHSRVRVLLDTSRQTTRRYNALWLPRAYALDERGIVTYVQSETTLDPRAPLQVAALWRQSPRPGPPIRIVSEHRDKQSEPAIAVQDPEGELK